MPLPAVSIVVPTRNRLASLRRVLPAVLCQEPAGAFEVLVIDDGSSDGSGEYLRAASGEAGLRVVTLPGRGAAAARNAGILAARGAVVACTDDDCLPPPDWAARLLERLEAIGAVAVGGRVVAAPGVPLPARISQAITNGLAAALNEDPLDAVFLTSNNVAYRRQALMDAGLFDEAFLGAGGEERELHQRLRARGGRLGFAAQVHVAHEANLDWPSFWRQQAAYGHGARLCYRRARALGPARPRRLGVRVRARSFLYALEELSPRERPVLWLAWPLSQTAVTWGYLQGG